MGTGSSGGNATDGNDITSPRPFSDDIEELENYTYKSIYGGDGNHYTADADPFNYNRQKMGMFELKKYIKKLIKEQAYGSATLTTQGPPRTGIRVPTDEYPFSAMPKRTATGMFEQEDEPIDPDYQGPSYDEVYLSKLVDSGMSSIFYKERNLFYIYPGMRDASNIPNPRLTTTYQSIVFKLEEGELHFVQAMIYERIYDELKSVFPELPQGYGGASGFTNINGGSEITYPILLPDGGNDIEKAKQMVQIVKKGLTQQANAESGFNDPERTGGFRHLGIGRGRINEQADAEQKAYEIGLKRLQKGVIQYQIKYIDDQRKKAVSQAAIAGSEAGKSFDEQIDALRDQIKAIDNPEEEQNESLFENYIKSRKNTNLMTHMDLYKQATLLEGTMKKLFDKFNKGETNEEVLSYYAKKGISMPETFLSKARKHYENVKKQKLEIGFMEQEAKDIITIPTKVPNLALFDLGDDNKKLAKGIYQEKK